MWNCRVASYNSNFCSALTKVKFILRPTVSRPVCPCNQATISDPREIFPSSTPCSGMLRIVALVRIDISEEFNVSIIRVTRIGKLGTLSVTRNGLLMWLPAHWFLSLWWCRCYVPPKRRILQETYGVTSQKTTFFIVTAVRTSNLTQFFCPTEIIYRYLWAF
jgi:hypothetical protein